MRNCKGYTLIEVLVALAMLVIGLLGMLSLGITGMWGNRHARHLSTASHLAQEKLEDLLSLDYENPLLQDRDNDGVNGLEDTLQAADYLDTVYQHIPVQGNYQFPYYVMWNVAPDQADNLAVQGLKTINVIVGWFEGGRWREMKACCAKARLGS